MNAIAKPTTAQVLEPPPKPKSHHDYTVGWVCALSKEQTAAFAMLDKQHPDLPIPSTDNNNYILGEICGHNVVIACLPSGQIGNNPAVAVATQMISTFQSIRFGLMVGIGGGVPSIVRLGDVVRQSGEGPAVIGGTRCNFTMLENNKGQTPKSVALKYGNRRIIGFLDMAPNPYRKFPVDIDQQFVVCGYD
ncbi:hypothetical protein TWF102_004640 [Orbilia oligospora]|uniref:Nucleoside phosphorylase domain-containing protein n=1 Tax=Orbilia oligospora TaxID=2813651 RepID=A0A7C8J8X2_ORBOL|nr:hypothetical protein TWF102_004640 [Orbilia oligospora]KAF3083759.1 hypothetical protein TWF706_001109 [Orbilia oligospora]KAF3095338.1 hypothetical protein TWF103_010308 [Orbilia oligospora]